MKRFAIIGTALSGNKGAAGMAIALIQNLSRLHPGARFSLLSYFPKSDRRLNHYPGVEIVSATPLALLCCFPLAAVAFLLRVCSLPLGPLRRIPTLRAIVECDLYLEAAGVSFVDGREKFLPLNVLWILLPLALGKRIIKVSQALGPFNNPINRTLAKILLPRVDLIGARGAKTADHLRSLGLTNFAIYPDVAFTLQLDDVRQEVLDRYVFPKSPKGVIGVSPSQVVYGKCLRRKIDYVRIIAAFIDRLVSEDYTVVLLPHSAREGTLKTRNNDLPISQIIFSRLAHPEKVAFVREELTPSELRVLIGRLDFLVASRFHAMISALAMNVPMLVFGWSHKYSEVLEGFNMQSAAFDYKDMTLSTVYHIFQEQYTKIPKTTEFLKDKLTLLNMHAADFYDTLLSHKNHTIS